MKPFIKWILAILVTVILLIIILVVSFILSMKPEKDEVDRIKEQATEYIANNFGDEVVVYDTLYDNMGNFNYFDYDAKAENKHH